MSTTPTPLLIAERRCTDLEQIDEADLFGEELHMVALWYELKRVRAEAIRATDAMGSEFARSDFELAAAAKRESELRSDLTRVADELKAAKDWILTDSKTIGQLRADLARVTAERDDWEVRAEEMDEYKADCMELRAKLKEYDTECTRLTDRASELEMERAALRARVAELEKDNEALNALVKANSSQGQGDIDSFCSNFPEASTLRARVAELEQSVAWHQRNQEACRDDSVEIGLRKRNAEMEAALADYRVRTKEIIDEDHQRIIALIHERDTYKARAEERRALRTEIEQSLGMESKPGDTSDDSLKRGLATIKRLRAEAATPAKHCADCDPSFRCWDGRESCYKQPLQSSTPAKHPDTVLLDWLEEAPSERLAEVRRILWQQRDTCTVVRAAIDAAHKQGGSHD